MTIRVRPGPAPATVSAMHLSEGRDGWRLTLSLTPDLLDLVAEAADEPGAARRTGAPVLRVQVQPNLLPGEPFDIDEITVVRLPEPHPGSPDPNNSRKARPA